MLTLVLERYRDRRKTSLASLMIRELSRQVRSLGRRSSRLSKQLVELTIASVALLPEALSSASPSEAVEAAGSLDPAEAGFRLVRKLGRKLAEAAVLVEGSRLILVRARRHPWRLEAWSKADASAHTHPIGPAVPSRRDLDCCGHPFAVARAVDGHTAVYTLVLKPTMTVVKATYAASAKLAQLASISASAKLPEATIAPLLNESQVREVEAAFMREAKASRAPVAVGEISSPADIIELVSQLAR